MYNDQSLSTMARHIYMHSRCLLYLAASICSVTGETRMCYIYIYIYYANVHFVGKHLNQS